jgi:hypothetical protein
MAALFFDGICDSGRPCSYSKLLDDWICFSPWLISSEFGACSISHMTTQESTCSRKLRMSRGEAHPTLLSELLPQYPRQVCFLLIRGMQKPKVTTLRVNVLLPEGK